MLFDDYILPVLCDGVVIIYLRLLEYLERICDMEKVMQANKKFAKVRDSLSENLTAYQLAFLKPLQFYYDLSIEDARVSLIAEAALKEM